MLHDVYWRGNRTEMFILLHRFFLCLSAFGHCLRNLGFQSSNCSCPKGKMYLLRMELLIKFYVIAVIMQAFKEPPPDMACKDKFLIQSTAVPEETTDEDITASMVILLSLSVLKFGYLVCIFIRLFFSVLQSGRQTH